MFVLQQSLIHGIPLDLLRVKGPDDGKTLAIRFFHFFHKLAVIESFNTFPSDFTIDGMNACTKSSLHCISREADQDVGLRQLNEKGGDLNIETLEVSECKQDEGRLSGRVFLVYASSDY